MPIDDVDGLISIHVPTRGTTDQEIEILIEQHISIHVPTRGTTIAEGIIKEVEKISIHVPTRGTTSTLT